MKHKKNRKFKRIKQRLWAGASGGLLAGMMLMSANTAYAVGVSQDNTTSQYEQVSVKTNKRMHMMRRWNSVPKVSALANQLGLDGEEVRQDLRSGKTIKQILQDHEIDVDEVQRAFEVRK
jgi:hypothetical protein